jgi:hypothetical protein
MDELELQNLAREMPQTLAFMPRFLVQTCLPHRDPGNVLAWTRENGWAQLTVQPAAQASMPQGITASLVWDQDGRSYWNFGIPYGSLPRLIIAYIETEVVRKQRQVIQLGDDYTAFMEKVGVVSKRGNDGTNQRLKEQMKRLCTCNFFYTANAGLADFRRFTLVSKLDNFWRRPGEISSWPSTLTLTYEAYTSFGECAKPMVLDTLRVLKKSPLELDIYAWLSERLYGMREPTKPISYATLALQFGGQYGRRRAFKASFDRALKNVLAEYRDAKVESTPNGIRLLPSKPHVTPKSLACFDANR